MNPKLLAVIFITIVIMVIILTGVGGSTVSGLISIFLVFVLPGYALTYALFPENNLETAEFIALTFGLSLAIAALGGLVLYWLQWGLQTQSWTILLGSITLISCMVALLRHSQLRGNPPSFIKVNVSFSIKEVLFFIVAGIGLVITFVLAYKGEINQNNSDFTQLWILPSNEADSTIDIGINNHSAEKLQYRLLIKLNSDLVLDHPTIDLNSEETWEQSFVLPEGVNSVTAELYRLYAPLDECNIGNPPDICQRNDEIYREVVWRK